MRGGALSRTDAMKVELDDATKVKLESPDLESLVYTLEEALTDSLISCRG
jgi:hypothetical protein